MKKIFTIIALAAFAFMLPACGDDEPDNPVPTPFDLSFSKLTTFTFNINDQSVNYIGDATYKLVGLQQNDKKPWGLYMIGISGIRFDKRMPVDVSFYLKGDFNDKVHFEKVKTYETNIVGHIANIHDLTMVDDQGQPMTSNYTVSDFMGVIEELDLFTAFAFTVSNQYRIVSIGGSICSESFYTDEGTAYEVIFNHKTMTAELVIYNVQFELDGVKSPVLKQISIPDLTAEPAKGGLKLTGDGITPLYYMNGQATPYPALSVTNFVSNVNIYDGTFDVDFDCRGGNYKVTNVPLRHKFKP